MAQHHAGLADALCAGGADVVLAEHVEHRCARHARDQRDIDEGQRAGRQDDALEERAETRGDAAEALHRHPAQVDGEDLDQDVADTKTGTEKPSTDRPITKRSIQVPCFQAAMTPRGTATRTARMMVDSAIEIEGSTRVADHLHVPAVGDQRRAEIAVQQLADPGDELHDQRLVEAERGADALEPFGRRVVAGEDRGGIARASAAAAGRRTARPRPSRDSGENAANEISSILIRWSAGQWGGAGLGLGFPLSA